MSLLGIKRLQDKVRYVLSHHPETRDSDSKLTIKVWQVFHRKSLLVGPGGDDDLAVHLTEVLKLPSQSSIVRIRARIQNVEGEFPPTNWEVARARKMQRMFWEEALGYNRTLFSF